ncbi:MAG: hypothetical protein LW635_15110, partial [Microcystis sp. 53598_E5]|nr:hypothetical protein [Microcystis sp. 53598_E5]
PLQRISRGSTSCLTHQETERDPPLCRSKPLPFASLFPDQRPTPNPTNKLFQQPLDTFREKIFLHRESLK